MARKTLLNAELKLLPPSNTKQVVAQINRQLRGIKSKLTFDVDDLNKKISKISAKSIKLKFDLTNLNNTLKRLQTQGITLKVNVKNNNLGVVNKTMKSISNSAKSATDDIEKFGEKSAQALRRYGAFTIATTGFFKLTAAISSGIDEAIKFDRELIRLSQVTGQSTDGLKGLSNEITRLSKEFGVSSSKILEVSVTLAQAGLSAKDTQTALEAIAKTGVSATFGDITNTTEAAIAVMQQFGKTAKDLEGILGSINAVSAKYAVESDDITTAVRRAGGAFQAAGGNLDEFQALFTSVRQTTRESAETIATGFRTIFTRLQRVRTQNFLGSLGIDVKDIEGQFVGPYKAIQKLSEALKNIPTTDSRFAQIIEELGGFRQVSKVIPLITKFGVAQEALNVSMRGGNSLTKDAETAQQALSVQITKVKEQFLELIRIVTNSSSFRGIVTATLSLTSALVRLTAALEPVLPMLGALAAINVAKSTGPFLRGFTKKGVSGFAAGGKVPGQGNSDTVPAVLTPGEFVIRKKAVEAIGVDNLNKVNKYASGGFVSKAQQGHSFKTGASLSSANDSSRLSANEFGAIFLNSIGGPKTFSGATKGGSRFTLRAGSLSPSAADTVRGQILENVEKSINDAAGFVASEIGGVGSIPSGKKAGLFKNIGVNSVVGSLFEGSLAVAADVYRDKASSSFDFPSGAGPKLGAYFGVPGNIPTEVKGAFSEKQVATIVNTKIPQYLNAQKTAAKASAIASSAGSNVNLVDLIRPEFTKKGIGGIDFNSILAWANAPEGTKNFRKPGFLKSNVTKEQIKKLNYEGHASGGSSTDTVAAMLTPGEYVINKRAARQIGMTNLNNLNKADKVRGYATGGAVGSIGSIASNPLAIGLLLSSLGAFGSSIEKADSSLTKLVNVLSDVAIQFVVFKSLIGETKKLIPGSSGPLSPAGAAARSIRNDNLNNRLNANINNSIPRQRVQRGKAFSIGTGESPIDNLVTNEDFTQISNHKLGRGAIRQRAAQAAFTQRLRNGIKGTSPLLGIGVGIAGEGLRSAARDQISNGVDRTGLAAVGGAASFAGKGAALGSVAGFPGAVAGGVGGAIYGFVSELKDATQELQKVNIAHSLSELSNTIDSAAKGRANAGAVVGRVAGTISSLPSSLAGLDDNRFKDVLAIFNQDANGIENFFRQVATESRSFEQFNSITKDTLKTFAVLTKTSYPELEKQIKAQIDAQNQARKSQLKFNAAQSAQVKNQQRLSSFSEAISQIADSFDSFDNELNTTADLLNGTFSPLNNRDLTGSIHSAASGQLGDTGRLSEIAKSVFSSFGQPGAEQSDVFVRTAQALKELPSILVKIKNQDPFANAGDFTERFENEVQKFGPEVANALREAVRGEIGSEAKDEKIISAISEDVGAVASKIGAAVQEVFNVMKDFAPQLKAQKDRIVGAFSQVSAAMVEGAKLEQKLFENAGEGITFNRKAVGGELDANQSINQRRAGIASGVGTADPRALARIMAQASNSIVGLRANAADQTLSLKEFEDLNSELAKQEAIYKVARSALEDVANSADELSVVQEALTNVEKKRAVNTGIADTQLFGSAEDRRNQERDLENFQNLRQVGNKAGLIQSLPEEDKARLGDLLKTLVDAGDAEAKQILDTARTQVLGANPGINNPAGAVVQGASPEAQALIAKGNEIFQRQSDAIVEMQTQAEDIGNALVSAISQQNADFLDGLKAIFKQSQIDKIGQEIAEAEQKRNTVGANLSALRKQGITGPNGAKDLQTALGIGQNALNARKNIAGIEGNFNTASSVLRKAGRNATTDDEVRKAITEAGALTGTNVDKFLQQKSLVSGDRLTTEQLGNTNIRDAGAVAKRAAEVNIQSALDEIDKAKNNAINTEKSTLRESSLSLADLGGAGRGIGSALEGKDIKGLETALNQFKGLSDSVGVEGEDALVKQLSELNKTIQELNNKQAGVAQFATGGVVGGSGNTDSVPAMLTPGEFVVNKSAVSKVGLNNLHKINNGFSKFAEGGIVGGATGATLNVDQFRSVVQTFSIAANKLSAAMSVFPSEITLNASHKVEVIFNGAQVLTQIQPEISRLVVEETKKQINNMIDKKFPDVGRV